MKALFLYGHGEDEEYEDELVGVFSVDEDAFAMQKLIDPTLEQSYLFDVPANPLAKDLIFEMHFSLYGCFGEHPVPPSLAHYSVRFGGEELEQAVGSIEYVFTLKAPDFTTAYNECVDRLNGKTLEYHVLSGRALVPMRGTLLPMEKRS